MSENTVMLDPTTLDETSDDSTQDEPLVSGSSATDVLIEEELLVEEISIDGMCGVY